jgi:hypothetical protein
MYYSSNNPKTPSRRNTTGFLKEWVKLAIMQRANAINKLKSDLGKVS